MDRRKSWQRCRASSSSDQKLCLRQSTQENGLEGEDVRTKASFSSVPSRDRGAEEAGEQGPALPARRGGVESSSDALTVRRTEGWRPPEARTASRTPAPARPVRPGAGRRSPLRQGPTENRAPQRELKVFVHPTRRSRERIKVYHSTDCHILRPCSSGSGQDDALSSLLHYNGFFGY